jgi:hypothetical protein
MWNVDAPRDNHVKLQQVYILFAIVQDDWEAVSIYVVHKFAGPEKGRSTVR